MKKTLFLMVLGLFTTMTMNAQNLKLEDVLKKHYAASGQDKLGKINTIKVTGNQSMMGMELPFTMLKKRPEKMRIEVEVQGNKMIQTYNGVEGYMIAPWTGSNEPQKVGDDQLGQFKEQANFDGVFFNFKENGSTLEIVGNEDINGAKAYKLKLVDKSGKISYHFIDCTNFNLVKSVATENMQGVDTEMETFYTNYKQVEGVLMPFSIEMKTGGNTFSQITFQEYKVNEELSDDLFEKPSI